MAAGRNSGGCSPPHISYQLHIHLRHQSRLEIGRLGSFDFPAGHYIYTGSARRNIGSRIRRHLSKNKKLRWHIDYLLTPPNSHITCVQTSPEPECKLNRLAGGCNLISNFGATDCINDCGSHLKYLGQHISR